MLVTDARTAHRLCVEFANVSTTALDDRRWNLILISAFRDGEKICTTQGEIPVPHTPPTAHQLDMHPWQKLKPKRYPEMRPDIHGA